MYSFQDSRTQVSIIRGEAGTWHSIASPLDPSRPPAEYTVRTRRILRRRAIYTPVQPVAVTTSDAEVWRKIVGDSPGSPREYILRAIGTGVKFKRADSERYVFGTYLSKSERHRNYLSKDGTPFDLWIQSAMYDFYPECYSWASSFWSKITGEWENELWDIIQSVSSSKHARQLLIDSYRKMEEKRYEEFAPAF